VAITGKAISRTKSRAKLRMGTPVRIYEWRDVDMIIHQNCNNYHFAVKQRLLSDQFNNHGQYSDEGYLRCDQIRNRVMTNHPAPMTISTGDIRFGSSNV
jgi:hypothetical protein